MNSEEFKRIEAEAKRRAAQDDDDTPHLPSNTKIRGFTTEQMLAWGKANAEAEREACAAMFDDRNVWDEEVGQRIRARGTT